MDRKDLIAILLTLPLDGTTSNLKENLDKYVPDSAYHQLSKQGYISLVEEAQSGITGASLTRLGIDWVKHHKKMAQSPNISL